MPPSAPLSAPARARAQLGLAGLALAAVALVAAPRTAAARAGEAGATEPAAPDDPTARIVPPQPRSTVTIDYPAALARESDPPAGEVVVRFVVGIDGVPIEVAIEQSLHPELDALALAAVTALRYQPATLDGEPVEIATRLAIPFTPPPREPEPAGPGDDTTAGRDPAPADDATAGDASIGGDDDVGRGPVRLRGRIREAGQRTPIEGATIVVVPVDPRTPTGRVKKTDYAQGAAPKWQRTRRSDERGDFVLRGTPAERVRVVVLAPGFERIEYIEQLGETTELEVAYYLRRLPTNPYRTVVRSVAEEREEVARRTITPAEIGNLPGTQGDALKAIQNFPGVARAPFGLGLLAIRGTGPNDSAVFIGYHEVPLLYHFGGLTSVFNADILERIDFVPGNFDSRYGDALGGIIDVQPRKGRRDGYHGYVDADIFDAGFLVEGRLGKGSFAVAARRSYIDFILPRVIPDDAGIDLTLAPRYWDDQILFDHPLAGGEFSVRVFGSSDKLKLVAADPNEVTADQRDRFETAQYFHRADVVWRKQKGPWEFLITPSYRYDMLQFGISDIFNFDLGVHNLTLRSELSHRASKLIKWRVGTELRAGRFTATVAAPPLAALDGGDTATQLQSKQTGWLVIPAVYSTVEITPGERLTLSPGVRVSYFGGIYGRASVEPRLRGAVQVAKKTVLKAGVGMFTQAAQPVEASKVYGNPRVGLERAVQTSLGVSQQLPFAISVDATGFFTYLYDEIAPSTGLVRRTDGTIGLETFANTQTGRTYGLEILARKQLTGSVFGWVAYTLNRSERRAAPGEPMLLADFDQTHILTLVGVWRLPRNWQIGGRFRLVSGNPYTPTVGAAYDASVGTYLPIEGRRNSARLPAFHQLDVRIDKAWVWKRVKLSLYLDVQNVYNHQNTEFLNPAFDYSLNAPVAGLPIIPSLGTKLEF